MQNTRIKAASAVAAVVAAVAVVGVVAYDNGKSDGKAAAVRYEVHFGGASVNVSDGRGVAVLRGNAPLLRNVADALDRVDLYIGQSKKLQVVGSYDGNAGSLTITRK